MRKLVAYLAHPVSAPTVEEVRANIDNARAWLAFLVGHTQWAICASWIPYVECWPDVTADDGPGPNRSRGLDDDLAMLRRCDLIVLAGGRVSSGMFLEKREARVCDLTICDVSRYRSPVDEVALIAMLATADREARGMARAERRCE